jgi:hypothetical protein
MTPNTPAVWPTREDTGLIDDDEEDAFGDFAEAIARAEFGAAYDGPRCVLARLS